MAKNFDNVTMDTAITNADKVLVGQADGDDVGTVMGEVKRFVKQPLDANFKNGLIIPFYIYPSDAYDNADIATIVELKKSNRDIPMIVIINPASGPGAGDGNYTAVINYMKGYGIHVIGYVSTAYGIGSGGTGKTVADIKADIDTWQTLYPEIDGIFFDEQSNGTSDLVAEFAFYKEVAEYARLKGLDITVSNPGSNVDNSFYDLFDVMIEWENLSYPSAADMRGPWPYGKQLFKRGLLRHTSATGELDGTEAADIALVVKNYGWVYVTADAAPNPWDTISAELDDLITVIKS